MQLEEILFRFLGVFVLTFLFGVQRQRSHKPIGFGTYIFVALGACGVTIAALETYPSNPLPLLSAIITGIGFLGAGALIKSADKIFGFTSAASIWLFSIFGLLVGLGEYTVAGLIYSSVWFIVLYDFYLQKRGIGSFRRRLTIVQKGFVEKKDVTKILAKDCKKFSLVQISADKKEGTTSLIYMIEGLSRDIERLMKDLFSQKWCEKVTLHE